MKRKPLTYRNFVIINGAEPVLLDSLPEEQRKEIGIKLADRMMAAMGYERVNKPDTTTGE